jgi:hypothetical protein
VSSSNALALRSDVVATVLDDGALLLDLESKYFFVLNPSAWALVQPFEQGATAAEVGAAALAAGAPDGAFADDVAAALVREGLAEPSTTMVTRRRGSGHGWSNMSRASASLAWMMASDAATSTSRGPQAKRRAAELIQPEGCSGRRR